MLRYQVFKPTFILLFTDKIACSSLDFSVYGLCSGKDCLVDFSVFDRVVEGFNFSSGNDLKPFIQSKVVYNNFPKYIAQSGSEQQSFGNQSKSFKSIEYGLVAEAKSCFEIKSKKLSLKLVKSINIPQDANERQVVSIRSNDQLSYASYLTSKSLSATEETETSSESEQICKNDNTNERSK